MSILVLRSFAAVGGSCTPGTYKGRKSVVMEDIAAGLLGHARQSTQSAATRAVSWVC